MKILAVLGVMLVTMEGTSGPPIAWDRMKEVYRRILPFLERIDPKLERKVRRLRPKVLLLTGLARNTKLLELFTERERELLIPCALHDWLESVEEDFRTMGTDDERATVEKLRTILNKRLRPNPKKLCSNVAQK